MVGRVGCGGGLGVCGAYVCVYVYMVYVCVSMCICGMCLCLCIYGCICVCVCVVCTCSGESCFHLYGIFVEGSLKVSHREANQIKR